jgi:hypothetical protein
MRDTNSIGAAVSRAIVSAMRGSNVYCVDGSDLLHVVHSLRSSAAMRVLDLPLPSPALSISIVPALFLLFFLAALAEEWRRHASPTRTDEIVFAEAYLEIGAG